MLEAASTVMKRRIGRCAIRNGRDRAARDPRGQDQWGITLQTLIITSVVVILAIAVSFTLFAINAGSSEDLEAAGQTDAGGTSCAPNEIFDSNYKSQGLGGPQNVGGVESSEIGCRPHCETWEFMTAGPNDDGEYELTKDWLRITQDNVGGPEGDDQNVFSSRKGCFAPCYWHLDAVNNVPTPGNVRLSTSSLRYDAENRVPGVNEVRLGVAYWRGTRTDRGYVDADVALAGDVSYARDGKPIIYRLYVDNNPGKPLPTALINAGLPTVFRPNWISYGARNGANWQDEDWEVRADPESETCEIVNTARNNELVCTSARDNCAPA